MSDLDQIQGKTEGSPQVARQYFYGGEVGDLRLKELSQSKRKSLQGRSDRLLCGPHTVVSVENDGQLI